MVRSTGCEDMMYDVRMKKKKLLEPQNGSDHAGGSLVQGP